MSSQVIWLCPTVPRARHQKDLAAPLLVTIAVEIVAATKVWAYCRDSISRELSTIEARVETVAIEAVKTALFFSRRYFDGSRKKRHCIPVTSRCEL